MGDVEPACKWRLVLTLRKRRSQIGLLIKGPCVVGQERASWGWQTNVEGRRSNRCRGIDRMKHLQEAAHHRWRRWT